MPRSRPDPLPLYAYERSAEADVLILQWWAMLGQSGELTTTFGRAATSLSAFFALVGSGESQLYYALDTHSQIALAFLVKPVLSGAAFLTLWVAPHWRHRPDAFATLEIAYEAALAHFGCLLGVTPHPRLLAVHQRWGYDLLGRLPSVMDGADGYLMLLTRTAYEAAKTAGRPKPARSRATEAA